MRGYFKVSTKAALFSRDRSRVLVIGMDHSDQLGLPGGHIEEGESPDEAIARELMEECGVTSSNLERTDFFFHSDGKLVLAYVGTADSETLKSTQDNLEGIPKWLTKAEFESIKIEPGYRELVLKSW